MSIVDDWEQTHDGRPLGTAEAGKLVHLIALGLARAYDHGAASPPEPTDTPRTG